MKKLDKYIIVVIIVLLASRFSMHAQNATKETRTLIVFFDGLRPDYITAEAMPNLYAFKQQGSYGKQHHSVFPTVTRVNASSYSTGSYPGTHGLLGNSVYFPEVSKNSSFNTGEYEDLDKIVAATHGKLLTAVSLGEILQSVGKKMMVFSSGSTGQAMMQNHTVSGGAVINPTMILPASFKETVINDLGPAPAGSKPNTARHKWVTDALIKYGLAADGPMVSAIWFSDPDGTAHSDGIGSPTAMASIRSVDEQFGRILKEIAAKGLTPFFNIMISTDHGFVTHIGKEGLSDFLIKQGFKKDKQSDDVVLAGGAIYVKDHDKEIIQKIIRSLQGQEWAGAIFTKGNKPGDMKGWVEGTLSFASIHWDHPDRAADILVDVNWNDTKNAAGYEGASYSGGVAGHGSLSPYEVHIPLIVSGPGFKKGIELDAPTSNVDIVPTLLYLHHIPVPASMDGRVINELLVSPGKNKAEKMKKETITTIAKTEWGTYELQLERSVIGKYIYVDYSKVKRTTATAK
jgi:predicted AlkP superfamily pyrophosphatase or phosphodiesterase